MGRALTKSPERKPAHNRRRLLPYEKTWIEWYASHAKAPSRSKQLDMMNRFRDEYNERQLNLGAPELGEPYNPSTLESLKKNTSFREYRDDLTDNQIRAARRKYLDILGKSIDAHEWAIEEARKANDYRAMAPLTVPALDRVMPKRDTIEAAPVVVVQLTTNAAQAIEAMQANEVPEVSYEVLEDEVDD